MLPNEGIKYMNCNQYTCIDCMNCLKNEMTKMNIKYMLINEIYV